MDIYTASEARKKLYRLIDEVAEFHEPACILGKRNKVMVMSEEDYNAMQETLFLLSIPGMRESILKGKKELLSQCAQKLEW